MNGEPVMSAMRLGEAAAPRLAAARRSDPGAAGSLAVELSALQSPTTRRRGIGRYALGWCRAVEEAAPGLIGRYVLDPGLPPLPGEAADLVASGKVRYRDASDALPAEVRVLHTFALLDLEVPLAQAWPDGPGEDLLRSVTVFDCIPALDPAVQLADPLQRRRYFARFQLCRAADQLEVLSASVRRDLERLLGVPAGRIVLAGCAPDRRFVPPGRRDQARDAAIAATPGLERPYVLAPSGSHPRKNNEALVRAWARLPERLLGSRQLVLTGSMPDEMQRHFHVLVDRLGIDGGLVLTGDVEDEHLVQLVQGAELACIPSLAEGFGLPIAEALACSTPVIASDLAPFDELLPDRARFDPTSVPAITVALAGALADTPASAVAGAPAGALAGARGDAGERRPNSSPLVSWSDVGRTASTALTRLLARAG
ncbi:MAG TPA: glycosyltransferase family 1 protein, partial [Acidimicrobiales bacterium]|nr:glycosyltransferase family 1 protein [Acidimicrobiales bacterium]